MWTSELFFTKIAFGIELLIAMYLFGHELSRKNHFALRISLSFLGCMILVILFPIFDGISFTWWYSSIMYIVLFLFCTGSLFFIYNTSWKRIFLISVYAYTAQHLAYQFFFLITKVFNIKEALFFNSYGSANVKVSDTSMTAILTGILVICYTIVYSFVAIVYSNKLSKSKAGISNFYVAIILFLVLLSDIIINSTIIYDLDGVKSSILAKMCIYNIIACLMIFFILYLIMNKKDLEVNLETSKQLLLMAKKQYQQNKENTDIINIKVHDLKQQIRTIGEKQIINENTLKNLEKEVEIYDSKVKTGNVAVDLIVNEKSLICKKENINLKVYADCSKLGFMEESDIYSLFGNALDNAIEATKQVDDISKRNINLYVRNVLGNKISVSIDNYFIGQIKLGSSGLPLTNKENKYYHGFGMKSMKMIADLYNAELKCSVEGNRFFLLLLFDADFKKENNNH